MTRPMTIFAVTGLLLTAACGEQAAAPVTPDSTGGLGLAMSEPVPHGPLPLGTSGASVSWIALPADSAPAGLSVTLRNRTNRSLVVAPLIAGGFDPRALPSRAGDTIEVTIIDSAFHRVTSLAVVPSRPRPPIVIRTSPPRGGTDLPLNSTVVVVFSKPINPATLTPAAIALQLNGQNVPGTLRPTDPTLLAVEFTPSAPLLPGSTYRVVISREVRDLQGIPLESGVETSFETSNTTITPTPVRVSVLPPFFEIEIGDTLRLGAQLIDSAGNPLSGTVTWSSPHPSIATVSSTGLVTGTGLGSAPIRAVYGNLSGEAVVRITGPILPGPSTAVLAVQSFQMIQFEYPGYVGPARFYAPLIRVIETGHVSDAFIYRVTIESPAVGTGLCAGGLRVSGQPYDLFQEIYGDYQITFSPPENVVVPDSVTARIVYGDWAGRRDSVTVSTKITHGSLPTTYTGGSVHHLYFFGSC